jgi:hypothetical protein
VTPKPPLLGRILLRLTLPHDHDGAIAGDLHEEYATRILPQHGAARAWRWYVAQVARSTPSLIASRWRRGELPLLLLIALVSVAIPLQLLEVLWAFVHSHIPLKADATRSSGILLANLVLLCGCGALGGMQ